MLRQLLKAGALYDPMNSGSVAKALLTSAELADYNIQMIKRQ